VAAPLLKNEMYIWLPDICFGKSALPNPFPLRPVDRVPDSTAIPTIPCYPCMLPD